MDRRTAQETTRKTTADSFVRLKIHTGLFSTHSVLYFVRHQQTCALGPLCGRSVKQFHIHLCSGLKHTDRQYRQQAAWRGMVRYLPHASWRILSAAGSLIDHLVSPHSVCLTRRPFVSQVSSPIIIGCALYFIHFVFNLYYICMQHSNFHTGLYYSESYICCQIN